MQYGLHRARYLSARAWILAAAAAAACAGQAARGDQLQNNAVSGSTAALNAAGFSFVGGNPLNGTLVTIGQYEPGIANSLKMSAGNGALPTGNPFLPARNFSYLGTAAFGANNDTNNGNNNHATEVAGVMVDSDPANPGIARGATIVVGQTGDVQLSQVGGSVGSPNLLSLIQQSFIVNESAARAVFAQATIGGKLLVNPQNNGTNNLSPFVDWSIGTFDPQAVYVVSGNEGPASITTQAGLNIFNGWGAPSDSYDVINVGATGSRNGAGQLVYTTLSNYNYQLTYNASTAMPVPGNVEDVNGNSINKQLTAAAALGVNSIPVTIPYNQTSDGRIGVDIVAPGGDPGPSGAQAANLAAGLTFVNQFVTTAGGQNLTTGSDTYLGQEATAPPQPNTTFSNYTTPLYTPTTIAGTSFAAPVVSGAAAIVEQYGQTVYGSGLSTDHRVIDAIIMNGASHANLFSSAGQGWQRAPQSLDANGNAAFVTSPVPGAMAPAGSPAAPANKFPAQPGLDRYLGTGQLNVAQSLTNYAAGRQQPTSILGVAGPAAIDNPTGWDLNSVPMNTAANTIVDAYTFKTGGGQFSATMDWDSQVTLANGGGAGNSVWTPGTASTLTRTTLTNLDFYLFQVNANGTLGSDIDYSTSPYDNVQYMYDSLQPGTYQIDVVDASAPTINTTYGIAWAVPEPTMLWAVVAGAGLMMRRGRSARV